MTDKLHWVNILWGIIEFFMRKKLFLYDLDSFDNSDWHLTRYEYLFCMCVSWYYCDYHHLRLHDWPWIKFFSLEDIRYYVEQFDKIQRLLVMPHRGKFIEKDFNWVKVVGWFLCVVLPPRREQQIDGFCLKICNGITMDQCTANLVTMASIKWQDYMIQR